MLRRAQDGALIQHKGRPANQTGVQCAPRA